MRFSERQIRHFWRTKYPWFFVIYILSIGILRGVLDNSQPDLALNLLMIFSFSSYVFLYVFYLYGVRPEEMEEWHQKYKKGKGQK